MLADTRTHTATTSQSHASGADDHRQVSSAELFGEGNVVRIVHDGNVYTLRKTRNGKLILTK